MSDAAHDPGREFEASQEAFDAAYRFLKSNSVADLRFDEHIMPLRYVFAPDGRLAAPVMVAMLQSFDTVLFVPEASDDSMEIMVGLEQFDEDSSEGGALADRWRIYHGEPDDVRWALMSIDCARYGGLIHDGEALMRTNPLAEHEATICRTFNSEKKNELTRLCTQLKDVDVPDPVCVGADDMGIDIRARFGILRISLDAPATSPEQLIESLAALQ